jgi:hypothetical protein
VIGDGLPTDQELLAKRYFLEFQFYFPSHELQEINFSEFKPLVSPDKPMVTSRANAEIIVMEPRLRRRQCRQTTHSSVALVL